MAGKTLRRIQFYRRHLSTLALALAAITVVSGCQQTQPDRELRMTRGYVYFLDGAGAGGGLKNYSHSISKGLLAAGYDGAGENFHWQTWLGVTIDQISTEQYKREQASKIAKRIVAFSKQYPDTPITLMGHSAGTAVAVFALEALPAEVHVENVILLSGSLSSEYSLTKALRQVNGRMFVTTSQKDVVLQFLVPLSGTADRALGATKTIGVEGPTPPASQKDETRRQYTKVIQIPWNEQFRNYGDNGAHSDTIKSSFVEAVVAPLIVTNSELTAPPPVKQAGQVENPDYHRWARFGPGSWIEFEGYQEIEGQREPLRMKATLLAKTPHRVMVQREFVTLGKLKDQTSLTRLYFASPFIDPTEHPVTDPQSITAGLPTETITIQGIAFESRGQSVQSSREFRDWGIKPKANVFLTPDIPGNCSRMELHTTLGGKAVSYVGTAKSYMALEN